MLLLLMLMLRRTTKIKPASESVTRSALVVIARYIFMPVATEVGALREGTTRR